MTDIIEKQLVGKRADMRLCEDGVFAGGDFIAVIDGVTSKGKQRWKRPAAISRTDFPAADMQRK